MTDSKPPLIFSAGIIPVHRFPKGARFLVLRAYNYWDFPKGMVNPGEDPFAAALRELQEETSISQVKFPWGHVFRETEPYSRGKVARYYVGETEVSTVELLVNPTLGRAEHQEFRWVSYSESRSLLVPRVLNILDWAKQFI